jgi:hypothetical protein
MCDEVSSCHAANLSTSAIFQYDMNIYYSFRIDISIIYIYILLNLKYKDKKIYFYIRLNLKYKNKKCTYQPI